MGRLMKKAADDMQVRVMDDIFSVAIFLPIHQA
jgi:hypothetical protein